MEENIIKIENAALKLGKFSMKPAIINIPKGYIVGIQGDNGAGKSTMLRMLLGMYDKMQGNIYIDGIDVVKNRTQIKNITGVVSQERTFLWRRMHMKMKGCMHHFIETGTAVNIVKCLKI